MFEGIPDGFRWREPWEPVPDGGPSLVAELLREVSGEHRLFGLEILAVARRIDCDDVMFTTSDPEAPLAIVHLTWSGKMESDRRFPQTAVYRSWQEWYEDCYRAPANIDSEEHIIKFDLLGQRRLVFDDNSVAYLADEIYPVPLPSFGALSINTNESLSFQDISWIGLVRRRQWWALVLGLVGGGLGIFWVFVSWREIGPLLFSVVWFNLMGVLPLWLYKRGRPFLAVVAANRAICIPADRKRKQVRRALKILKERCPPDRIRWERIPEDLLP